MRLEVQKLGNYMYVFFQGMKTNGIEWQFVCKNTMNKPSISLVGYFKAYYKKTVEICVCVRWQSEETPCICILQNTVHV